MSTNNCFNCPSLAGRKEAAAYFGIGEQEAAPMCLQYGHLFGPPGSDVVVDEAAKKLASGCDGFGKSRASAASSMPVASWYQPRSELLVPGVALSSCMSCMNFDSAKSACAASGRIIFESRRDSEAGKCAFGNSGTGALQQANPVPVYVGNATSYTGSAPGGTGSSAPQAAPTSAPKPKAVTKKQASIEPDKYDSDLPVSDDAKRQGIRAWRRFVTKRSKEEFYPIFRSDFFGEDADKIPSKDDDHGDPSAYVDHGGLMETFLAIVYGLDQNLVIEGEPGTGKTEGVRWLAYELNMPFRRLAYNEASEPEQYLGMMQYDPTKGTYLDPGHLPLGWVKPGFLLSDEPNLAPDAIMQSYRSMNDSSRVLSVYKEKFQRHDYCFHMMAINPAWDFRNIGTKPLASADSRRMTFMWMPNPDKKMLTEIINKQYERTTGNKPSPDLVKLIIKIGDDLRGMSKEGTLPDFWTVSQEIKVARLSDHFGLEEAYRLAYFNHIDPKDAEPAMAAIKSHVPYGSEWA